MLHFEKLVDYSNVKCYNTFVNEATMLSLYTFNFHKEEKTMKRKIALLLAAVMTVAMLPMNAMADSSTSLSRTNLNFQADKVFVRGADVDVSDGAYASDAFTSPASATPITLDIRPTSSEVEEGSKIILRVNNGKFDDRFCV